jgi:pimeloyl-ACP methyl ester carboxylesterase
VSGLPAPEGRIADGRGRFVWLVSRLPPETGLDRWWAEGRQLTVRLASGDHEVFVHVSGDGPWLTLLHGFPTSSYEWARLMPTLTAEHRVLALDFLGFGRSAKPPGHRYSVFEQADLLDAVWQALDITDTSVVAYDYGAIVAQELLARRLSEPQCTSLQRLLLLNAGVYAELYRPLLAQRLSITPGIGRLLTALFNERMFTRTWSKLFSAEHPLEHAVAAEHYRALRHNDPARDVQRRLLVYIHERAEHHERLERALTDTDVPLHFLWGMQDPVSGARIAHALRTRIPAIDLIEYPDAGHCPHIETPARVANDITQRTSGCSDSSKGRTT